MNVVIPPVHDPIGQFSSKHLSVTPPLPARIKRSTPYLSGEERLTNSNFKLGPSDLTLSSTNEQTSSTLLSIGASSFGPPIPPRAPLKRSLSLTNRPPPPPVHKSPSTNQSTTTNRVPPHMTEHAPLIVDPLRVRTPTNNLARSAPTLSNINNNHVLLFSSRGQIKFVPLNQSNHERNESNVHVVPLARWPLSEVQPRLGQLTIDSLAGKFSASLNEYVEGPGAISKLRIHGNKQLSSPNSNSQRQSNMAHLTSLSPHSCVTSIVVTNEKRSYSVFDKLRKLMSGKGKSRSGLSSDNNSITTPLTVQLTTNPKSVECTNSIICRKCGKCRCRDCLKRSSRKYLNLPGKDAVVDCLSCMCLVKPVFYHCLKDSNGEEDCSEKPCACCSQPNCMSRWTVMTFLLPCLPCLCFYLPLKYAVSSCYDCCHDNTSCSCAQSMPTSSGFKTLLESENSSI